MNTINSILSFISVANEVLSPAMDVINSKEFKYIFNGTASDDRNNSDNEGTTDTEKR